ncbi:MAG: phosphate acetyltransferase [Candidatus Krumholzibacteriia bacterium]|jgi:phosphate acetyltransferase
MEFVQNLRHRAAALNKTIVLPEGHDDRVLQAAGQLCAEEIAQVILLGGEEQVHQQLSAAGVNTAGITVIDPALSTYRTEFARRYFEMRQHKKMSESEATQAMQDPLFFGAMLVHEGVADGMVAGAANATSKVLRAGFQIVGTAPEVDTVSSCFFLIKDGWKFGTNGMFVCGDCAVNPQPNAEQLAAIAVATARSAQTLANFEPRVALLSFSTAGSGSGPDVDKVIKATELARQLAPDLLIDGPLQLDAAIVPEVGRQKAPDSKVAGSANVLIFPDLDAGNIGYKLVQRLAGAEAVGPILQGMAAGLNDLSRGCSVSDIVNVAAITALQSH